MSRGQQKGEYKNATCNTKHNVETETLNATTTWFDLTTETYNHKYNRRSGTNRKEQYKAINTDPSNRTYNKKSAFFGILRLNQ